MLQLRELRRVAKSVLDPSLGLHIVPTMIDGKWCLETLSDSDFAKTRKQ